MTLSKFETTGTDYDVLAPYDINFVVLSDDKGMKSQIALGIAKALNTYGICDKNKIVRAKASELNRQDFSIIFGKISGGCLIIERADELSDASVAIIENVVNQENQDVAIVFESRQDELKAFWKKHKELRGKFLNVINVSKYNEMELVTLAKGYIEKRGYELSPEAAIVLRDFFKKKNQKEQPLWDIISQFSHEIDGKAMPHPSGWRSAPENIRENLGAIHRLKRLPFIVRGCPISPLGQRKRAHVRRSGRYAL